MVGYLAAAAAATAYAAWLLACPWTRWMMLPLVFAATFGVLYSRRAEAFFRRMATTCLVGGVIAGAFPTLHLLFLSPHGSGALSFSNENVVVGVATVLVGAVFGVLEYLRSRDESRGGGRGHEGNGGTTNTVNVSGGTIGSQNIVFGNQSNTYVTGVAEVDGLLAQIKILIRNGLTKEASDAIADLESRMWGRLDQAQKARLRALRGACKFAQEDHAGSARDFMEAHELNPTDERGFAYKCNALFTQGQKDAAYAEARAVLARTPSNGHVRAFLITCAPSEIPLDELMPAHWKDIDLSSEVAVAAADRVRTHDAALAETILRKVKNPSDDDGYYWSSLGTLIAQAEEDRRLSGSAPEPARLTEAVAAFERTFRAMKGDAFRAKRGYTALFISRLMKQLGRHDERIRWLETARELIPEKVDVLTERAQAAHDRDDYSLAASLLREVIKQPERPGRVWLVLAHSLLKLGGDAHTAEACEVLEAATSDSNERDVDRRRAAILLVETLIDQGSSASEGAIERHRALLGEYEVLRLRLARAEKGGKREEALVIAREMIEAQSRFSPDDMVDFGLILNAIDMHEACVDVLLERTPRNALTRAVMALIESSLALGRMELVASVCSELRGAGVRDSQLVDAEAYVRALRGDLSGALELTQSWLRDHSDDKRVRLRQCLVAKDLGRTELLPQRADELPEPTPREPQIAVEVVEVLRAGGHFDEARRFAYEQLKRNRKSEWAWRAVMHAGMPRQSHTDDDDRAGPEEPTVQPGTAVRIREGTDTRWVSIETHESLATAEDEYGPDHPFARALIGKRVGDTVEMPRASASLPAPKFHIEAITNCFTRAYQDSWSSWERRFPNSRVVQMFHVPESVDDLIKLLLPGLKQRRESVETITKAYAEEGGLSLHALADLCDRSLFDVIPYLVANGTRVHAARPAADMDAAKQVVRTNRELIIDATAISTLMMLRAVDRIPSLISTPWVSSATVDALRVYVRGVATDVSAGYLGADGEQLVLHQRDKKTDALRNENLKAILANVEGLSVFTETDRASFSPSRWDAWTQIAGAGTAESIHRAKRLGIPVWCDDARVAACASYEGVEVISTQAVFEVLAELKVIEPDVLHETTAKLIGWQYVDTRTPPESFLAAARLAKWDANAWPLVRYLELLTSASWPAPATAFITTEVFRLWWSHAVDRKALDALIVAVMIRLAARSDGRIIIALILRAVPLRFSLDIIGARHVLEAVLGWVQAHDV